MKNRSGLVNVLLIIVLCIFILGILNGISVLIGQKPIIYFEKITYDNNVRYSGLGYWIHYCNNSDKPRITRKSVIFETACLTKENETIRQRYETEGREQFKLVGKLEENKRLFFTDHVSYKNGYLFDAIINGEITIEEVIGKMKFYKYLDEYQSKVYKYEKENQYFGESDFYAVFCNTSDTNDIMFAKKEKTLDNICIYGYNDIPSVSISIKDNILSNSKATIVIKDDSKRFNVFYNAYSIEELDNGNWKMLYTYIDNTKTNDILYLNKNNELEFNINFEKEYQILNPGRYRFKTFTMEKTEGRVHYLTYEFEIEK